MIKLIDILNLMDRLQNISVHINRDYNVFSASVNTAKNVLPDDILHAEVTNIECLASWNEAGVIHIKVKKKKREEYNHEN